MSQQFFQNPHEMQDHLPRKFRFAPFVILIALVSYAVIVVAMLTAPSTAKAMGAAPSVKTAIDVSNSTPWTLPLDLAAAQPGTVGISCCPTVARS